MRVLVLSPRPCQPPDTGAKLREYHLLRQLATGMEVDLLAFHTGEPFELPFCGQTRVLPRPPRYTPAKLLRGLLGGLPVSVVNYTSAEMAEALAGMLEARRYDVILLESIHMIGYLDVIERLGAGALIVYDWHNIESELMERYAAQSSSVPHKLYALETARRLRVLEKRIWRSGAGHVVCSERERARLLAWLGPGRVEVVANGVDVAAMPVAEGLDAGRRRVLFVGSMDYHANIEAVRMFAERHWPALHARRPDWTFTIVGARPVEAVRELGGREGIEVTGTVESVAPYYGEAAVVVVPLLEGGGTRLKVVEAMAAGVPVVSTPLGAEGIEARDGQEIVLLEADGDWPGRIAALVEDGEAWMRMSRAGREMAEQVYDWRAIGARFAEVLGEWRSGR